MTFPFKINIQNYRSIQEGCNIPFNKKSTFVVGQNNTGKSNILRALASVFNKKYDAGDAKALYEIKIRSNLTDYPGLPPNLKSIIQREGFLLKIDSAGELSTSAPSSALNSYAGSHILLEELGSKNSNHNTNILSICRRVYDYIRPQLNGTTYVPTTRFITEIGAEPAHFSSFSMPGETIAYGRIIEQLSEMDRPPTDKRELRESFKKIEDFLSYCLEKPKTKIEIPNDKKTIHLTIGGSERPLVDLGTGVEQLLIIGLASLGFPDRLVLIDEPELHFHPRAQKRMIQYLNNEVDAKFIFATHSAAVLDAIDADVLQVTYDGKTSSVRTITNNNQKYQAVRDLGHSPSDVLQTRFAIWVEGPSDRVYLNHWISKIDPSLLEGIDYTILFYGGKILSHHSFVDEHSELVKAVSLAREYAVIMDSDRKPKKPRINSTKIRVQDEIDKQGGICWITEGREIENYLPSSVIKTLQENFSGVTVPKTKLDQILDPEKVKKSDFARAAITIDTDEWPMDLKKRVSQLVEAIKKAR